MPAADRDAPLEEDVARAETALPLPPEAARDFLSGIERLFRLNPHLEIERWEALPNGFFLAALNETNGRRIETAAHVEIGRDEIAVRYASGLKRSTELRVGPAEGGARLVVTERYPRIEDSEDPRVAEVDRSLVPWVAAIRRHLIARARWGWIPGWRGWNERFMPSMAPRQRRIVRLLVWITALEFAVFLALVLALRAAS